MNNGHPVGIEGRVHEMIVEHLGVDTIKVVPGAKLVSDLGCDSLDKLDLIMGAEGKFGINISDDEADTLVTVADVVALVERKMAEIA